MSYPQQPYPQQPQPHWQGQGPGPGFPPKQASGGTTTAAAILALLSGLISGFFLVSSLIAISGYVGIAVDHPVFWISFGGQGIAVLLLLVGAIMLFARAGAGRFLVVAGVVIKLGLVVWSFIGVSGIVVARLPLIGLITLLLGIIAAVLAILPSTAAHIAAKKKGPQGFPPQGPPPGFPPQGPPPYGMPPQQGMPPQGMPPQGMPPQGYPQTGYGPPPG
ncbi:hypothetical protein FKR81_27315 [Lentzea tibetensis]|uniref:Uncharacterized protein n=1 Tax=Lentzea tibetensis TaxID=2591470 RepID=A0A563EMT9_9PSEU|nr:hypothetical protein [Lentzea tibetensis]TWP48638.1 hypothetical protein FKR81_27315 [Lentzea tibetensis]